MPYDLQIIKYYLWDQFFFKMHRRKLNHFELKNVAHSIELFLESQIGVTVDDFSSTTYTIFDLETTGFFPQIGDEVLSIGAIKVQNYKIQYDEAFYTVLKPFKKVPKSVQQLTGITMETVQNAQLFPVGLQKFLEYSQGTVLVAHPATFDVEFLKTSIKKWKLPNFNPTYIDSHKLANQMYTDKKNYLDHLIKRLGINERERHHALNDAIMTAEIFVQLVQLMKEMIDSTTTYEIERG
ncbi:3'-5' exonuclease [Metabacillus malikii]|uniref:DNA polymerase III epsilon subunit family exonuclease n=1 Tax=Metabacillus malikii TaxID=1504265 RepID=A0ABT9ZCN7_9BACI|nr:3'-5' exonuclease [Metabacillus malikii]MDQ0230036.1 DNA polymerase III epsilon subunit family exonuclease [Metabacillus malikii]